MSLPLLFGAGVLAGGLWWATRKRVRSDSTDDTDTEDPDMLAPTALPAGVRLAHDGIKLTPRQVAFLKAVRRVVSMAVLPEIVVTSGVRSYDSQAKVMLDKLAGGEPLRKLYGQVVESRLLALPHTIEAWSAEIEQMYSERLLNPDGHVGGGAVDLRTRDLTGAQVAALIAAAKLAGGRTLLETTPPHLHVDHLPEAP